MTGEYYTMLRINLGLLALCLLLALGCGQNQEESGQSGGLIAPSPTPPVHRHDFVWNSPTIDLRVFRSDVVARVKPLSSVVGKVETVPSGAGVVPTYRGSVEFNFAVNGAAANIERIEWMSSGEVDMWLNPGVSRRGI